MKTLYPASEYLEQHFQHLHAAITLDAARSYMQFVKNGNGKMIVTLASDTQLPDIGETLAQLIRSGLVHAVVTTATAIEDDLQLLRLAGTSDTQIPSKAIITTYDSIRKLWRQASKEGRRLFHWEIINQLINSSVQKGRLDPIPTHSWLCAACEHNIPVYAPGIENSTFGRLFVADVIRGGITSYTTMKSGTEQYAHLCDWYQVQQLNHDIGIFQVGDNVTSDFSRSIVASIGHEQGANCKLLRYCTVVSDQPIHPATVNQHYIKHSSTGKKVTKNHCCKHTGNHDVQDPDTQSFNINADATTIVPLMFNYILELWAQQQANDLLARTLSRVSYG